MKELIFTTSSNPGLAESIASKANLLLGKCEIKRFIDHEISIRIKGSVKNRNVYVLGSSFPPAENLLELLILINTLRINGVRKITAIIPYFGYGRSDNQYQPGTSINARLMARMIRLAGVQKVIAIDLHSSRVENFFSIPLSHISALSIFAKYIKKQKIKNYAVASPDKGGVDRARILAALLGIKKIIKLEKRRPAVEQVRVVHVSGNVKNKNIIVVDDMIQSGKTIMKAAKALKERGANNIYVAITHLACPQVSIKKIQRVKYIKKIIVTNTIPQFLQRLPNKFEVLKIDNLVAKNIK